MKNPNIPPTSPTINPSNENMANIVEGEDNNIKGLWSEGIRKICSSNSCWLLSWTKLRRYDRNYWTTVL